MKKRIVLFSVLAVMICLCPFVVFSAYHHEGEDDAPKFLSVYPDKAGTKLDNCALCHCGGVVGKNTYGSCQWCHYKYGYDGSGNILDTLNSFGLAYRNEGSSTAALQTIESLDSDGDGYTNIVEIQATRYPGDANDDPNKVMAPYRVYTKAQLEAMTQHTQFMVMNTSRSGDSYDEYTGVPMKELLDDAGIDLDNATHIIAYATDGWAQTHSLYYNSEDSEDYHVYGNMTEDYQYPASSYYYDTEADILTNPTYGWCDYSAPGCVGRSHGAPITVENGLKAILAIRHNGTYLEPGVLNDENKLDGEGPFRVIVPQKNPNAPDQSSKSSYQEVIWPYNYDWDHNAGACSKTVTIIKVGPLPEDTTDIDVLEAGWAYVDEEKIVIYGAIDGTDSNGNGILDSEEKVDPSADYDDDGTPDYADSDTAYPRHANGTDNVLLHTSAGDFSEVMTLSDDDPQVSQTGKPSGYEFPYGVFKFNIIGLSTGQSVTLTLVFPEDIPITTRYYKVSSTGDWVRILLGSNDGDNTVTLTLTDGDPDTDADGVANGTIVDPGGLVVPASSSGDDDDHDGGLCFIGTAAVPYSMNVLSMLAVFGIGLISIFRIKK